MARDVWIGLDLGGTALKAGAVSPRGRLLAWREELVDDQAPRAVAARMARVVRSLQGKAGGRLRGVGVGVPGPIDVARGVVTSAPNMPGWRDVPIARWVARATGVPAVIENDANAAALGECWVGAGRGRRSVVLYTLGTGIGGGIVLDGKLWHGAKGGAGELGHVPVEPDGRRCPCGARGCIEAYASARAVVKRFRELRAVRRSRIGGRDAKEICDAARKGDPLARSVVQEAGRYLGLAVAGVVNTLNPEVVILGGGMSAAGGVILSPVRAAVRAHALPLMRKGLRIVSARLGNAAGAIGAAGCALNAFAISAS